ncbi:MAG: hypothetical protein K8R48_01980 [Alphaproteobacteria bacterium]|nr:hypothetical protein [Alphaproteobacteria bacterium]
MLSDRLQFDLSAVLSSLKADMGAGPAGAVEDFSQGCQEIVARCRQASQPKESEIYQAALLYLQGRIGADVEYLYDLVAFGLYRPIACAGNRCVADDRKKLEVLLNRYRDEARRGCLWETTWFGVLQAYHQPSLRFSEQDLFLKFLKETYPSVIATVRQAPLWMKILDGNPGLLGRDPCRAYAEEWLAGNRAPLQQIAADLHIPAESWFWQELTRACIRCAVDKPDEDFKRLIPRLLALIGERPRFLDEDLETILHRYSRCSDKSAHEELKRFALRHWKSPKLGHVPGSKWLQVQEPARQLVLGWVNDDNLRLFFERISARRGAGGDRLSSWLRYISWTKFVSDPAIAGLEQKDPEIARLLGLEEEILTAMDDAPDEKLDDFMMRIGDYRAAA